MNSGDLAYDLSLAARAQQRPAHGEALPVPAPADIPKRVDRGADWPLMFAFFTPVVAAYAAIAYGVYAFVNAAF